jgi:hypothetical protein
MMSPERRKEVAAQGARAAMEAGTAHRWNPTTAAIAGQLGGLGVSKKKL